jgi:hypothetical protein
MNTILKRKVKFPKKVFFYSGLIVVPLSISGCFMHSEYQATIQACQHYICDVDQEKISGALKFMRAPIFLESRITAEKQVFNYLSSRGLSKHSNYPLINSIRQVVLSNKVPDIDKKEAIKLLAEEYSAAAEHSVSSYSPYTFVLNLSLSVVIALFIAIAYLFVFSILFNGLIFE